MQSLEIKNKSFERIKYILQSFLIEKLEIPSEYQTELLKLALPCTNWILNYLFQQKPISNINNNKINIGNKTSYYYDYFSVLPSSEKGLCLSDPVKVEIASRKECTEMILQYSYYDSHFNLCGFDRSTFLTWINTNRHSNFLTLPLFYSPGEESSFYINSMKDNSMPAGHITTLIIDTSSKQVFLLDVNGQSSSYFHQKFFSRALSKFTTLIQSNIVEKIVQLYIEQLKSELVYVESDLWNPRPMSLNPRIEGCLIGNGHCYILTLLLFHYLVLSNSSPAHTLELFYQISEEQRLSLILGYSQHLYFEIKKLKIK